MIRIPCTTCSLDLKTYKIYDKNHVEIQPNADNEIIIDIMCVKKRVSIFHCVYLTLFKSYIPIGFMKYINALSYIDIRDKVSFKDNFIPYSSCPIEYSKYPGYRWIPRYPELLVNKDGEILNIKTGTILDQIDTIVSTGYLYVKTYDPMYGKYVYAIVHRIVALAWCDGLNGPDKVYVNHIDGNKKNNKANNLEWVTAKQNIDHGYRTGLMQNNLLCWSRNIHTNEIKQHHSLRDFNLYTGRVGETVVEHNTNFPGKIYKGNNGVFELAISAPVPRWYYVNAEVDSIGAQQPLYRLDLPNGKFRCFTSIIAAKKYKNDNGIYSRIIAIDPNFRKLTKCGVEIKDIENNKVYTFNSATLAAKFLKVSVSHIQKILKRNIEDRIYFNKYLLRYSNPGSPWSDKPKSPRVKTDKEYVLTDTETGEKQHILGTINVERLTGKRVQVINRHFNTLKRNRMEFGKYVLELVSPMP